MVSQKSLALSQRRLCRSEENTAFVILNEVKNLTHLIRCRTQILRLTPQNDIATRERVKNLFLALVIEGEERVRVRVKHNVEITRI
jgi:CelD/BcsL family acetyltransferase involved in cellulose biosynthesis